MQAQDTMKDMKNIVELLRKKPRATYTLTDVERLGLIPWARNGRTIRKAIDADFEGGNLLGAIVTGAASQRRYLLPARGLIKYLQTYGPALMATVRKPKHNHGNIKRKRRGK